MSSWYVKQDVALTAVQFMFEPNGSAVDVTLRGASLADLVKIAKMPEVQEELERLQAEADGDIQEEVEADSCEAGRYYP